MLLWGSGRCTQYDSGTHCSRGNSSSAIGSPPGNFTLTNRSTGLLDQNAVAACAVAEERVFDLDYFRHLKDFTCGWKQHSATLKWFREECEKNGTKQETFSNTEATLVPEMVHPPGTDYHFNQEGEWRSWRWQEMIAQLDPASMEKVVEGPERRSRGIIKRRLQQCEVYDHKRQAASRANYGHTAVAGKVQLQWDYVLERDDGTCISLHPNYSNTKIQCYYGLREADRRSFVI